MIAVFWSPLFEQFFKKELLGNKPTNIAPMKKVHIGLEFPSLVLTFSVTEYVRGSVKTWGEERNTRTA